MAASRYIKPPELKAFVRQLTVHKDGIAWLDVNDLLLTLGIEGRVVQSKLPELRGWLTLGLPVVLAIKEAGVGTLLWRVV